MKEIPIYYDNTSTIAITQNLVLHSTTKHINIRYHFIRDHAEKKDMQIEYVYIEKTISRHIHKASVWIKI